jgi:hypothetical protein
MLLLAGLHLGWSQTSGRIGAKPFVHILNRQFVHIHLQLLLEVLDAIILPLLVCKENEVNYYKVLQIGNVSIILGNNIAHTISC